MPPCLTLIAATALVAVSLAQTDPPRPADKPAQPKAPFVFEAGTTELRTLIQRCAVYLEWNILADDADLQVGGRSNKQRQQAPAAANEAPPAEIAITLQMPVVTDRDGCEELLSSLLWTRSLVLAPLDEGKRVYEVLYLHGPRAVEIQQRALQRTPEQVLARPSLRQFVTVVQVLQHTNSTYASNSLRPFFATSGQQGAASLNVGTIGNTTSLVLTGPQNLVANALRILQAADQPQPPEAMPDVVQRLDAIAHQTAQLAQRLAALEKADKPSK